MCQMTNKATKRKTWIDITRILCMFIIITGHTPCYENTVLAYLTTFHVAVFFIISGYLYHPQSLRKEIVKSFKSLMIPYIILGITNIAYWSFIQPHTTGTPLPHNIMLYSVQLITTSIGLPMIGPLWFLVVLFMLRICFIKIRRGITISIFCILSILIALFINHLFETSAFYAPLNIFLAIPFFLMGYISQTYGQNIDRLLSISLNRRIPATLILFCLSYIVFCFQGGNNMSKHDFGNNIITFYICAIIGSLWIIILASIVAQQNSSKLHSWLTITNNGLPLMIGLQIMMIDIIKRICSIYAFHIIEASAIGMVIIIICIPITIFCMRYCPWIIGRKAKY